MQNNDSTIQRFNGSTGRGGRGTANPTAEAIVSRLPDKPLLTARDIADALFMTTAKAVTDAVDDGGLSAVRVGNQYRIARDEAARWIRSLEASK